MGRKCAVPDCYTGYRNCKEKAPLYRVPDDNILLTKWQEAIARADRLITPNDFVCAKHFRNDDLLTQRIIKDAVETYQRPRLRPDAIPSIFPDPPQSIHGTVRKRRKLSAYEQMNKNDSNDNEKTESDRNTTDQVIETSDGKTTESVSLSIITSEITIKEEIELPTETEADASKSVDTYVNSDGEYCCDQCDYKSKWQNNVITHKVVHSSVFLRCEFCPHYTTKWKSVMKNHMKTKHSLHKEIYICGLCRFESMSKEYMKKHKMNHGKQGDTLQVDSVDMNKCDKYFRCMICSFQVESEAAMLSHIGIAHQDLVTNGDSKRETSEIQTNSRNKKYFPCLECSYKAASKKDMLIHFKTEHKNRAKKETRESGSIENKTVDSHFSCPVCKFFGQSKSDTLNHYKLFHQGVVIKRELVFENKSDSPVSSGDKMANDKYVRHRKEVDRNTLDAVDSHVVYIKTEFEEY
ncbi:unnamed protein product [Acanthoscelides obtectus]|uniref:THAP-type domain-containing protein n=1 Tax=Acanthoscelides obtectus TaxID=200917 RepID=A0A9P0QAC2_ACAOB|nr:unnamed protein product [Acanthoscelides obtectus]CAK1638732.1 hypothetical protein AOBTE_LOCUS10787 [Acanthoscelides obtectus]